MEVRLRAERGRLADRAEVSNECRRELSQASREHRVVERIIEINDERRRLEGNREDRSWTRWNSSLEAEGSREGVVHRGLGHRDSLRNRGDGLARRGRPPSPFVQSRLAVPRPSWISSNRKTAGSSDEQRHWRLGRADLRAAEAEVKSRLDELKAVRAEFSRCSDSRREAAGACHHVGQDDGVDA